MSNIEEYKTEETIRLSYFRNRGNLAAVLKEVNLPADYVKKTVVKIKKSEDWKVSRLIADTISKELLLGRESRITHWMETLKELQDSRVKRSSTCCYWRVRVLEPIGGVERFECLKCGKETDIHFYLDEDTLQKKMSALEALRREDEMLGKFAVSMGWVENEEAKTVIKQQNNFVVVPNANGQVDEKTARDIKALRPMEQEALRLQIEKTLMDAEIVEDVVDGEIRS